MTRIDELIRQVLPELEVEPPMKPSDVLDAAAAPPPQVAERVYALRELVHSGGSDRELSGRMADSRDVVDYFRPRLENERVETLWVVALDAKNRVRLVHMVSKGGVAGTCVGPADFLRPLVLNAATSAVMLHNHPSGDPTPSPEDVALTERIYRGCELLGIRLVDHVIVGTEGYFSFLDSGLLSSSR